MSNTGKGGEQAQEETEAQVNTLPFPSEVLSEEAEPEGKDHRKEYVLGLLKSGTTLRALARNIGTPPSSLSDWAHGRRAVPETSRLVSRWLVSLRVASRGRTYVETPSAKVVQRTCWHAQQHGEFTCIYGGPGLGKTMAIKQYVENHPGAFFATVSTSTSGLIPALEVVAEALGVVETVSGARRLSVAIQRKLETHEQPVLIIDEAQHLSMLAVEELRAIHDATGCGLVLAGNESSYTRFLGSARTAHYAQIRSRIGIKMQLTKPSRGDVESIAKAWCITNPDAVTVLHEMSQRPGALRSAVRLLLICGRGGEEITPDSLRAATKLYGAE